jgi:hypothetical protein
MAFEIVCRANESPGEQLVEVIAKKMGSRSVVVVTTDSSNPLWTATKLEVS